MSSISSKKSNILAKRSLPDNPGVYFFMGENKEILYIGKATSLRDRVRSYFSQDIAATRGPKIVRMLELAQDVKWKTTDSVLEALLLEAQLIKKHQPPYNTDEKDDKSFYYVVITKEAFPRVLLVRGRDLNAFGSELSRNNFVDSHRPGVALASREAFSLSRQGEKTVPEKSSSAPKPSLDNSLLKKNLREMKTKYIFGPFPQGGSLKEALKIIRRIFPFRDNCKPLSGKPCFDAQIGLCPGVCSGKMNAREYAKIIKHIKFFFEGKKKTLVRVLEKEMNAHAKNLAFEEAQKIKKTLFALDHIHDVALLKKDAVTNQVGFRIEAYDVAHLSGKNVVGVMTVVEDGRPNKSEYRQFKVKVDANNDVKNLEEILMRRMRHLEWRMPDLIVVDGFELQIRVANEVLRRYDKNIPVASVVKDERHKPKDVLGDRKMADMYHDQILLANSEAHRFAITFHRKLRKKNFLKAKK